VSTSVDGGQTVGVKTRGVLGGRYRLEEPLGSGGMSVVWRAHDDVLGRLVAVKLLAGRYATDPSSRRRIHDEARAVAALSHPNIAQVYDFGESVEHGECVPYVVMELVAGRTLDQCIAAGSLPPRVAFRICAEVAAALGAAHAEGLVHRDVKPANVMVTLAGAKVVDFGISAAVRPPGSTGPDNELLGTPAYLAPERLTGDAVEPASDVYALGVLLYKLLVGQLPWSAETSTQMLTAQVYIEPAPLPALPDVPGEVADLCRRCLDKEPASRPTARQVAVALADAAGVRTVDTVDDELARVLAVEAPAGKPLTAPVRGLAAGAGVTGTAGPRRRVRVAVVAAALVGIVVAAGMGSWLVLAGDTKRPGPQQARHQPSQIAQPGSTSRPGLDASTSRSTPAGTPSVPLASASGVINAAPVPGTSRPTAGTTSPAAPTSTSPPPNPPQPQQRSLSSVGGTVEATCTLDGLARLLSWTPAKPYKVERVDPGPASPATAVFGHGNSTVQMSITCTGGVPSATTIPPGN
jgi:eukaryotic-like serine/threonine-protein kinase